MSLSQLVTFGLGATPDISRMITGGLYHAIYVPPNLLPDGPIFIVVKNQQVFARSKAEKLLAKVK